MKYKTASFIAILMALMLFVIGPVALVYLVDPFQIYHKSYFKNAGYSTEQAYQHAGWINTVLADPAENYSSLIIGSSTMANYTESLINEHLPWGKTLNLSVNGSTPRMQASIARYALAKKPDIKHILWDVHYFYIYEADHDNSKPGSPFPYYLYNSSILDDKNYLFNTSNVNFSLQFLRGDFTKFSLGIENNGPFYENLLAEGRFAAHGSDDYKQNTILPAIQDVARVLPPADELDAYQYPSIDKNLLDVLMPYCNSDKDIAIMFSPEDRSAYTNTTNTEHIVRKINMRRYIVNQTRGCKNIRIFSFDNLDWITAHPENYADDFHFTIEINHYIADSIARNLNRLTPENIDEYQANFIDNINHYKSRLLADLAHNAPKR
ncbi:MAG TPA: hypothetical protein PLF22_01150 [Pseudomonadales bacterium]|nr:hypothetical protein [Pseudomonadales bacterium]